MASFTIPVAAAGQAALLLPCGAAADRQAFSRPSSTGRRLKAGPVAQLPAASVKASRRVQSQRLHATEQQAATVPKEDRPEEYYEVQLDKPIGIRFARGNDGGAYAVAMESRVGNVDERIEAGDKLVEVSASFGDDVWEARNYGQVMYALRTRVGGVYMKFKKNYGDMSAMEEEEISEAERMWRAERAGGNYGAGTKEVQQKNYVARKEAERKRREQFDDALALFKQGEVEKALIEFENVISLEPKNYVGDDFSRTTDVFRVSQYNVACCYAVLDKPEPGLEALKSALDVGFEDFPKVRADPNLANLRKVPAFKTLIDRYDEPIINEAALNALKSLFSFGKK